MLPAGRGGRRNGRRVNEGGRASRGRVNRGRAGEQRAGGRAGGALGQFQQAEHKGALTGRPVKIAMLPPRDVLYARIDARFDVMLEQGAMDEVRQLMSRQLDPSLPLMKALGVTALKAVLEQEMTVDEAAYIAKRDSRHYAKRQMTWLRNNYNAQITLNTKLSESFMESIFSLIC